MADILSNIGGFFTELWVTFIAVMSSFNFIDLIDIIVVSYIIYKIIQFVRGTRAKQLIYGVFLFILIWLVSSLFNMRALSSMLSAVLTQGIIALAVIFQPEIRSALELLSKSKLKISRSDFSEAQVVESCINAVCNACTDFQNTKTGALIVFERDVKLGDIIKTGTIVDSQATVEIIKNIFYPNTPLHDGAIIIREGRVYAASCILPLTLDSNVDKSLGTRHRASLGMSENSDAIIVVVSEETGTISVAQHGMLRRNFNQHSLSDYLTEQLIDKKEDKKSLLTSVFSRKKGGQEDE